MPPRSRRLSLHACHRQPVAMFLAVALTVAGLPAVAMAVNVAGASIQVGASIPDAAVHPSPAPGSPARTVPNIPSPEVVGAASDPLGRLWVRTDVNGNGTIGVHLGTDASAKRYRAELVAGSGWRPPNGPGGERWIPVAWSTGASGATDPPVVGIQPLVPAPVGKVLSTVNQWTGRFNLYRANAFVTQKTFKWCVAASVQMMVNLVRNHRDRTTKTQATMIAYAQRWDRGPYGEDGGTDVTGWINALRHFGAGKYRAVGATSAAKALRIAATAMRQTGRPAGILVMEGRHAWVLHGFESRTDPQRHAWSRISAVRISGPLYPVQQKGGYDPPPNTRLSVKALARYFKPSSVGAMVGRYVVVIPTH